MSRQWEEVPDEGGEFYKFNNIGDVFEGTFLRARTSITEYGEQRVYDMSAGDEERTLAGTFNLKQKMEKIPIGAFVRIEYVEEVPTKAGAMKKFDVKWDRASVSGNGSAHPPAPARKPLGAEDDIPF